MLVLKAAEAEICEGVANTLIRLVEATVKVEISAAEEKAESLKVERPCTETAIAQSGDHSSEGTATRAGALERASQLISWDERASKQSRHS